MGSTIAEEIGMYGHRPSVLMDMLAGKRVDVDVEVRSYKRSFYGDCSPFYLETAFQVCFIRCLTVKLLVFSSFCLLNFNIIWSIIYVVMTLHFLWNTFVWLSCPTHMTWVWGYDELQNPLQIHEKLKKKNVNLPVFNYVSNTDSSKMHHIHQQSK